MPARAFETLVADSLAQHLEEAAERHALLAAPDPASAPAVAAAAKALIARIRAARHRPLAGLIQDGRISRDHLAIRLDPTALAADLSVAPDALDPELLTLAVPFSLRRRGVETRLVAGTLRPAPDPTLIALVRIPVVLIAPHVVPRRGQRIRSGSAVQRPISARS
ncbi:MAG: hypothetical protein U1E48_07230 [Paracoccaceae bacterium]